MEVPTTRLSRSIQTVEKTHENSPTEIYNPFYYWSYPLMAQPQHTTEQQVVALIDNVIGWQSQQTEHIEKFTLTNWQFATYYIGMMKAYKTTGNKSLSGVPYSNR